MKIHKLTLKILSKVCPLPNTPADGLLKKNIHANLDGNNLMIQPRQSAKISLGYSIDIPEGWVAMITTNTQLYQQKRLRIAEGVVILDSKYKDEWFITLASDSSSTEIVENNEKIADVVFMKAKNVVFYPAIKRDTHE